MVFVRTALDNRDNVVGVDDEGVPIRQYRCRRRNRSGVREPDSTTTRLRVALPVRVALEPGRGAAGPTAPAGLAAKGSCRDRSRRQDRNHRPLFVTFDQASIREKSSLNRPSQTSLCAPPLRT